MNELPQLPLYLFEPSLGGVLSTVLTFLLPLVAALVIRQSWGTGLKGTALLAVAAVKVFLEAVIAHINSGVSFNVWVILYGVLLNFLVAVAVHFGLLRGTSIQQSAVNSGNTDRNTYRGEVV
jgi:hypothetical protein